LASLVDQFSGPSGERLALDRLVLRALGVDDGRAEELLREVYAVLAHELREIARF
jgi:hypothetical protein